MVKTCGIEHLHFYEMLSSDDGKCQLAFLISEVCRMLQIVSKIGAIYGNLRLENILLKFNLSKYKIEGVKFLNFGSVV